VEHLIQLESKYDLCHQHRVSIQRFETYYMKNTVSYRGSIVWNLLEPSTVSTRGDAKLKRAKKSPALRNLNLSEESPQMGPQIDSDFIFY